MARTREPLTRERVLQAAVALADEKGADAVTMRKLAAELGVEAMSLYHHVPNKNALLGGMVDIVVEQFEPPRGEDWRAAIRSSAISAHAAFRRHRWACRLMLATGPRSGGMSAQLGYMESLLSCLREGGFHAGLAFHAYHALNAHIMGFTLWEGSFDGDVDIEAMAASFLRRFPADEFPYVHEHVHQHLPGNRPDEVGEFEFVLDLILDGLERLRDAQPST
jgi:AcrR family transcriptional regulator